MILAVRTFSDAQRPADTSVEAAPGIVSERRWVALDSVGVCVPSGRFPLPSSLVMTAVPALVAGVRRIAVVTPNPVAATLVAARELGLEEIYSIGGAQAVAALAYGTETVPAVDKIIGPAAIHTFSSEGAGHAVIAGASIREIPWAEDGTMDLADIRAAVRDPNDVHEPITAMLTIENSHALSMGQPLPPDYVASVADVAREIGVPLFIDGARLFNASVALGVPARDLVPPGASATFCLSKSLGCPVGSVVVGDAAFIDRARRARKMVGGGMRQAGVIAAAGVVALQDGPDGMIERLAEDHANARRLAEGLAELDGVVSAGGSAQPAPGRLDPDRIRTNFVMFKVERDRAAFLAALRARGVEMVEYPHGQVRAVTHYGVTAADIETTIVATRAALADTRPTIPASAAPEPVVANA